MSAHANAFRPAISGLAAISGLTAILAMALTASAQSNSTAQFDVDEATIERTYDVRDVLEAAQGPFHPNANTAREFVERTVRDAMADLRFRSELRLEPAGDESRRAEDETSLSQRDDLPVFWDGFDLVVAATERSHRQIQRQLAGIRQARFEPVLVSLQVVMRPPYDASWLEFQGQSIEPRTSDNRAEALSPDDAGPLAEVRVGTSVQVASESFAPAKMFVANRDQLTEFLEPENAPGLRRHGNGARL